MLQQTSRFKRSVLGASEYAVAKERVLLVGQASRSRYARRRRARRELPDWESLAQEFEQKRDYQQVLSHVLALSARFQASLDSQQRQQWLELEEALLEHSWLLHGEYFRAGYELGSSVGAHREPDDPLGTRRSQAALVHALTCLVRQLAWPRR